MFFQPKASRRFVISAILGGALTSCAGLDTRLPDISAPDLAAETQRQETDALRQIEDNTALLLNVGWPVLTANSELCPKIAPSIGIQTHTLKSYPKRLRSSAGRVLGADDTPRIFQIVKGGPADLAGFKRGDIIIDDEGEPARLGSDDWKEALSDNVIEVVRGDETLSLTVTPVTACNYNLRLTSSAAINAYADGRNITFTNGMMDFIASDDELALIVGHELGHNTMGHIRKVVGNFILSFGATRYTRPFESEADYVGLYYLVRAGYSPEGVEEFWQRLARVSPKSINRAKTHPTFPDRFLRIRATRKEIAAKQDAGLPLIPNFKEKSESSNS